MKSEWAWMKDTVDDDSVCYCGWNGIDSDGCTCLSGEAE